MVEMDWDLILKTYPDDRQGILTAKSLYDCVLETIKKTDFPKIDTSRISNGDYQQLVPLLTDICNKAWKECFGTKPSFDMISAVDAFIWGGCINVTENDSHAIGALMNNALRAALRKLRDISPEPENPDTYSGKCAFCSSHPRIAIDEESQRMLHCSLCGFTWRYPRIKCVYCGNADHEKLGFFEAEGIDGIKVYFCRECKHFIKAVDAKDKIMPDADTIDAVTLEIDELAKEEGFIHVP